MPMGIVLRHNWNTGRLYTTKGQLIEAVLLKDGMIQFRDYSRGITGEFKIRRPEFIQTGKDLEIAVMYSYDNHEYDSGPVNWDWPKEPLVLKG